MLQSAKTWITVLLGTALATVAGAQNTRAPSTRVHQQGLSCSACHTCEKPTPENPCLRACTRDPAAAGMRDSDRWKLGPAMVILNELEDLYLPVPFDHKGHAEMAQMTRGCAVCHHYTPEGAAVQPACKTCHEVSPLRADMHKPGLKAAYHRQCLNCHREWSHETACEVCHQPKAGRSPRDRKREAPTKDDIMGLMHPPIPEPDTKIYQTKHKQVEGTKVIFRHKEHIHRFGFSCAECHHEDSCSRCHEKGKPASKPVKTLEQHHNPCAACHDMESPNRCAHCHWEPGKPKPKPFDHAGTGWTLNRYHQDRVCRVCHVKVPFGRLDRSCNKCHKSWVPGKFDHAITGQVLDEQHVRLPCSACHIDRNFAVPPTCDECHDEEDDGIAFPGKRPGPVLKLKKPGAPNAPGDAKRKPKGDPAPPTREKQPRN